MLAAIYNFVSVYNKRQKTFKELSQMSDKELNDIGITRSMILSIVKDIN